MAYGRLMLRPFVGLLACNPAELTIHIAAAVAPVLAQRGSFVVMSYALLACLQWGINNIRLVLANG